MRKEDSKMVSGKLPLKAVVIAALVSFALSTAVVYVDAVLKEGVFPDEFFSILVIGLGLPLGLTLRGRAR